MALRLRLRWGFGEVGAVAPVPGLGLDGPDEAEAPGVLLEPLVLGVGAACGLDVDGAAVLVRRESRRRSWRRPGADAPSLVPDVEGFDVAFVQSLLEHPIPERRVDLERATSVASCAGHL